MEWAEKYQTQLKIMGFIVGFFILYLFLKHSKDKHIQVFAFIPVKKGLTRKPKFFRSKREDICRNIIETLLQAPFPKIRPDFLKNPKTGKNLELDMYNEELKLAIEVDGKQHYAFNPIFHKSQKDFDYQIQKDNLKNKMCQEYGIQMFRIPYTIPTKKIQDFIKENLTRLGYL